MWKQLKKMGRGSNFIESFLGNEMFPCDLKENAASDPSWLLPFRVKMSFCGSLPFPLIYLHFFLTSKLVLTALNTLVAALKYIRKTFLSPAGGHCAIQ